MFEDDKYLKNLMLMGALRRTTINRSKLVFGKPILKGGKILPTFLNYSNASAINTLLNLIGVKRKFEISYGKSVGEFVYLIKQNEVFREEVFKAYMKENIAERNVMEVNYEEDLSFTRWKLKELTESEREDFINEELKGSLNIRDKDLEKAYEIIKNQELQENYINIYTTQDLDKNVYISTVIPEDLKNLTGTARTVANFNSKFFIKTKAKGKLIKEEFYLKMKAHKASKALKEEEEKSGEDLFECC